MSGVKEGRAVAVGPVRAERSCDDHPGEDKVPGEEGMGAGS